MNTLQLNSAGTFDPAAIAQATQRRGRPAHSPTCASAEATRQANPIAILGVPFDHVTTAETLARIEAMIASRQPHYAATANVDFLVQAREDVELHRILLDAHLVLADGMPLVWASRWLGNPLPERVTGSDLVPRLLAEAEHKGWRVFFLGGTETSVAAAAAKVRAKHPHLQLVGAYSPPFRPLLEMNHEDILERIRAARPDILLVAFGCPKQEKWISMHYRAAGVPLSIGVGATIDFLAGTVSRAPRWMQRSGLEWVYRLLQEPRRLFRRYTTDFWGFGRAIARQSWQLRTKPRQSCSSTKAFLTPLGGTDFRELEVSPRLDANAVKEHQHVWDEALAAGSHVLVNLAPVECIDSTGVGLLVRLGKDLRAAGRQLVLLAPSPAVRRALESMRLAEFLPTAPTPAAALRLVAKRAAEQSAVGAKNPDRAGESLAWQGELVAANAEAVWRSTENHLQYQASQATEAFIDLSALRFIDSSGVALMVRAKKLGQRLGITVTFTRPTAAVRQVIQMLRLEETLLGGRQ